MVIFLLQGFDLLPVGSSMKVSTRMEVRTMAKVSAELLEKLQAGEDEQMQLIVRTTDDPGQYVAFLEGQGIEVRQQFRLTRRLAIQGPAVACLALVNESWVEVLEEDRPVHTWEG